ncbi:HlyD family secretion protein, partial [Pseudomonas aeruginosa]|nr:HlyD family secretion protein [Pseudomonas aeruginosa]
MIRILSLLLLCVFAAACSPGGDKPKEEASAQASGSYERGPNNGRLLRDGDFALEVTIYETNVPPHYRLYAYRDGKPVAPADVVATIKLSRLDGEVNQFTFTPEGNY